MSRRRSPSRFAVPALAAATILIAVGGYLLAIGPQRSQARALDGRLAEARVRLETLERQRAQPASLHASDLFRLAKAMPASDDQAGMVARLAAEAKASSVRLTSVTPSTAAPGSSGTTMLPLDVVVEGRFANVSDFLRRLRASVAVHGHRPVVGGRLFVVDQVQLTPGTGRAVDATLALDAFVYGTADLPPGSQATTDTTTTTTTTSGASAAPSAGSGG